MEITNDIKYIGVNDHEIDLFEGQYKVPNGMAYNSYVILDDKIAVFDGVDKAFTREWMENIQRKTGSRDVDYLIIQHMEPDHSGSIEEFLNKYKNAEIVTTKQAYKILENILDARLLKKHRIVGDGDTLNLGSHILSFYSAPMVHWPEVMVTYEEKEKILFSADAFGKFGALDVDEDWACEARRYYFGIVGAFGVQVQGLLKKVGGLDIQKICPLHGPVLTEDIGYYVNLYNTWSSYEPEDKGVLIAYTSVYGTTKKAVEYLAKKLEEKGCPKVVLGDLARDDMAEVLEDAFRYDKLVLATTTYNGGIFPFMREFIAELDDHKYQNRSIGFVGNGTWGPTAPRIMHKATEGWKNITYVEPVVTIKGNVNGEIEKELEELAAALCR